MKGAKTVFKLTRSLAEYYDDEADFSATLKDVLRDGFDVSPLYESWLAEIDGFLLVLATFCHLHNLQRLSLYEPRQP